jgi:aspartate/tyrosine/aromatic aminotransferase
MTSPYPKPIPTIPLDAIFELSARYRADKDPNKVDLGIGAYRNGHGKPIILDVVRDVEVALAQQALPKEYLPIDGLPEFRTASVRLLYGDNAPLERIASVQTVSGTGAVRIAAEFYGKFVGKDVAVYASDPTWPNHPNIFQHAGFANTKTYRYFDPTTKGFAFRAFMEDIQKLPPRSILILQVTAHNPTGADPTEDQWNTIAEALAKRRDVAILMDCAYQGYASGDLDKDAIAVRVFLKQGLEFCTCQSFSKNMGLYAERVGCLAVVCKDAKVAEAVGSQLRGIIRASYSNPPAHGARIASAILNTPALRERWVTELKQMSGRIVSMRKALRGHLEKLRTPGDWSHITTQIGMFSYLGLTPQQCSMLVSKHHIYLTQSARISVAGLHDGNVAYVAKAIDAVVRSNVSTSKL